MDTADVLIEAYGRIHELVHEAASGLSAEDLAYRPEPGANSIAWLVWHLTRLQDQRLAGLAGGEELWVVGRWYDRLGMPPTTDTGVGHSAAQVAAVRPHDSDALLAYHDAVADRTRAYLATVDADELDRVVDATADPPVTVGNRLVAVLSGLLQHAGQARYLRGIVDRRRP
jgi:uncharacterized damage-inducible protein DinB